MYKKLKYPILACIGVLAFITGYDLGEKCFPRKGQRPLTTYQLLSVKGEFKAGGPELNGEQITTDMPTSEHLINKGGVDGAGLCVFTSIEHCAVWANEPSLIGFRDFMTRHEGGGYPEKVDKFIPLMAKYKNAQAPSYIQHTGGDPKFLELALKTGRMVAVTYAGQDGVFYRGPIAHMVNLVYLSDKTACILDNNNPGKYLWMTREAFLQRWKAMGGGWAFVLLKAGPPPIPVNWEGEVTPDWKRVLPPGRKLVGQTGNNKFDEALNRLMDKINEPLNDPDRPRNPEPMNDSFVDFGIKTELVETKESYRFNGQRIDKEQANKILVGQLVDDSVLYRLTIVFEDETLRKRIIEDLKTHPSLIGWKSKMLIQDYSPSHWAVKGVGLESGIILQTPPKPDGKAPVLFRCSSYEGPQQLAEALRKADDRYNPKVDPDPSKDNGIDLSNIKLPNFDLKKVPNWVWLGGACVVFYLLYSKEDKGNSKSKKG